MSTCAHCRAANGPGAAACWNCGITLSGVDAMTVPGTGAYPATATHDPMIGRQILEQYVIVSKIAAGGMGALYLAEQPSVGRHAVIKLVQPWLARDPTVAQRFGIEARAAARLQNPHIVSIYNYARMNDGTLFIAMEHIRGCTLGELIRAEGRLEPARAISIATQICEALAEAHRKGVIHRDLKPANIMLVSRGGGPDFVKVLDFGIASLEGSESQVTAKVVGTPRYIAPELVTDGRPNPRTDIYSLALIVYEMLTGRSPFVADSPAEYLSKHLNEAPPSLMQACPGVVVPPALEACLMRALAKAPHQRPQSADQLADELWSALTATVEISDVQVPIPRAKAPGNRAIVLASAAAVLSLAAASVAVYVWLDRGGDLARAEPASTSQPDPPPVRPEGGTLPAWPGWAAPTPEKERLLGRDTDQLEAELERVQLLSGLPRSAIERSTMEYRHAVAHPPPGVDPDLYRKTLLVELIVRWRAAQAETPPPDRSLDELEAVFLTMKSPLDVRARRRMLDDLKNTKVGEADSEQTIKRTVMGWIAEHGGSWPSADSEEPEFADDPSLIEE